MTALVLTTTTFTLERKKIFGSFFTATNELLLGLVDEKLTSFQYPLAFFCINSSLQKYASTGSKYLYGRHSFSPFFVHPCMARVCLTADEFISRGVSLFTIVGVGGISYVSPLKI